MGIHEDFDQFVSQSAYRMGHINISVKRFFISLTVLKQNSKPSSKLIDDDIEFCFKTINVLTSLLLIDDDL